MHHKFKRPLHQIRLCLNKYSRPNEIHATNLPLKACIDRVITLDRCIVFSLNGVTISGVAMAVQRPTIAGRSYPRHPAMKSRQRTDQRLSATAAPARSPIEWQQFCEHTSGKWTEQ